MTARHRNAGGVGRHDDDTTAAIATASARATPTAPLTPALGTPGQQATTGAANVTATSPSRVAHEAGLDGDDGGGSSGGDGGGRVDPATPTGRDTFGGRPFEPQDDNDNGNDNDNDVDLGTDESNAEVDDGGGGGDGGGDGSDFETAGPSRNRPPRHPTHAQPSVLE
jgi:hypothetical protein